MITKRLCIVFGINKSNCNFFVVVVGKNLIVDIFFLFFGVGLFCRRFKTLSLVEGFKALAVGRYMVGVGKMLNVCKSVLFLKS